MTSSVDDLAPPPAHLRSAAVACFGERVDLAVRYAHVLLTDGVVRGLIGPRESDRIWDRHLLNCAVVAELIPQDAHVVDVGSGAGLPGVVLALARPDLMVTLVEPLARRAAFLAEVIAELRLRQASLVRARAEECVARRGRTKVGPADVVTARAVAPLDRLAAWCLPLLVEGGRLLALKGDSATDEVAIHRTAIARAGGGDPEIRRCGAGLVEPPTTVVTIPRLRRAEH
ncbi:MAG TPA: 16S rRNA (guanine(527)-N(7))-methyltransferase RsmG [Micromonosporaceae bacterium]